MILFAKIQINKSCLEIVYNKAFKLVEWRHKSNLNQNIDKV